MRRYSFAVPADADPDFARTVLLCSKPLQVLNCASIVRHYGIADARLHVLTAPIDDIEGFRSFLLGSGYADLFSTISWNVDAQAAIEDFTHTPYDTVFVDDDRLRAYLLIIPHRTERLVLFEEGIGTYRTSPTRALRGLRKLKWRAIAARTGAGWTFGSGRQTDLVLVSRPDAYRRLNPRTAPKARGFPGLVDELRREPESWNRAVRAAIGHPDGPLGRTALVLATWGGASAEALERAGSADVVFYKAHPHDGAGPPPGDVVEVDGSWIPAEALVEVLASMSDELTVYHHSSSVEFYTRGHYANVRYVDLLGNTQLRDVLAALDG